MAQASFSSIFSSKNPRFLEERLSAFVHRFPVSGRIVHALAQEVGGVPGLAVRLEQFGFFDDLGVWLKGGKPKTIAIQKIKEIFPEVTLNRIAQGLEIPRESVEIQAALGVPKFFATLIQDEDDELGFAYGNHQRGSRHSVIFSGQ